MVTSVDGALACRGIRGAIGVSERGVEHATARLLDAIIEVNGCALEDVAAAIFTLTDDLPDANPAAIARARGWEGVPLLVTREHGGGTSVPRCIRVLVLWNTDRAQSDVRHVYLGAAGVLRPDLAAVRPSQEAEPSQQIEPSRQVEPSGPGVPSHEDAR